LPNYENLTCQKQPEAFLYPLLVKKVKEVLEKTIVDKNNFQIFLTTHSPDFLREVNNPTYCFVNVEQKKEEATYARSKRDVDINKYSTINPFDKRTKYQVLKNYGLLDEVDDYEDIIICEGRTDKNYLAQIIRDEEFFPQIRYGKYAEGIGTKSGQQLNYDYVGSGASAVLPILAFLDNVSEINRKVFVLLDGDEEGRKVADKIRPNEYRHLEIKVYRLPDNLEIEDVIFSKEDYISGVLEASEDIRERELQFREVIDKLGEGESLIQKTEAFIDLHKLSQRIGYIKHELSTNLHSKTLRDEWLLKELRSFFDSE
jgi:5S rRNA maturation endonuclease (ribonuclease M5)